jgi:uncharacterized protein YbjT (DUF2867 family)
MRIAVAGGTGTVGRHVAEAARGAAHDVVLMASAFDDWLRGADHAHPA